MLSLGISDNKCYVWRRDLCLWRSCNLNDRAKIIDLSSQEHNVMLRVRMMYFFKMQLCAHLFGIPTCRIHLRNNTAPMVLKSVCTASGVIPFLACLLVLLTFFESGNPHSCLR
jgi:hypothetical protein